VKNTFLGILIVIGIMYFGISTAQADDINTLVSVSADYWMPSIDATIRSSELSLIGTDINFIDDLGLDNNASIPNFKASVDLPLFPEILVSYFAIKNDAEKTLTKNLEYKGTTYSVSDLVSSSYDIKHYEALLGFALINNDFAKFALLVGAKYFDVKTSLANSLVTQSDSINGPVPVVGVMGDIRLPAKFRLEAIARGLDLEINDINAKLYDIEAAVHYDFNRFLRASAGYRYFLIKAEDNSTNDSVDIKFTGPYVGFTGSF
jgi:outer membrane protein